MRLIYYRSTVPNFGDDLNNDLWPALAPELFAGNEEPDQGFVGIGTIIGSPAEGVHRLHVFSSGVGNDPLDAWRDREVTWWCVRGPVSVRKLGLDAACTLTDGAVLTPFVKGYPKAAAQEQAKVLVIPHFQSLRFGGWDRACQMAGFELLDPRAPPKEVVAKIASAKMVLTESLHGAIFADLYGVPWHAFAVTKNFGVVKWIDWLAGLGRPFEVTPVPAPDMRLVLAYGRRSEPMGRQITFTLDDVEQEFYQRLGASEAPSPGLKSLAKTTMARVPGAGRLLGYHPAGTAEGLTRLAMTSARSTAPTIIGRLQERMLERLQALRVSQAGLR